MRRLILLRHAKAVRNAAAGDKDRALEKRGRLAAERIGDWLSREGLRPDLALVSDSRRTRETFALAASRMSPSPAMRMEPRIYEAAVETLFRLVRMTDPRIGTLMLVGHNPSIADLAAALVGGGDRAAWARMRLKFPTCALADLRVPGAWSEIGPGAAELIRFVTPATLDPAAEDD